MTENSDSGFTEINQIRSNDSSQYAKSGTPSPEPDLRKKQGESSVPMDSKSGNDSASPSNSRSMSKSSSSDSGSSSDDDSDDDDYDGGKPSVLNWVSLQRILSLPSFLTAMDNCRSVNKCRKVLIPVTSSKSFCIIFIFRKT